MRRGWKLRGFAIGLTVVLATYGGAAYGGDDDDNGEESAGSIPDDRDAIIAEFPEDVQSMLTDDIPTPVLGALLETRRSGPGTMVLKDSGGELFQGETEAFIADWEEITGWAVQNASPVATPGDVRAQVQGGQPAWDMIEIGSIGEAMLMENEDLLEPLNPEILNAVTETFPEGYQHTDHWIQYSYFGVILIWDEREWPNEGNHPESAIEDLFNFEEFPGKRCLFGYPQFAGTLEYPLLAAGADPESLYPLDVEAALDELDEHRSDIVFWNSGAESVQFIVSGECQIGVAWHGRPALRLREEPDLPIGASWQDALLIDAAYGIPKGARNAQAANSLLGLAFTAQNQCDFINALGYGIPIDEECIDEFGQQWGMTEANFAQTSVHQDAEYYADNIDEVLEEFNAWLTQ